MPPRTYTHDDVNHIREQLALIDEGRRLRLRGVLCELYPQLVELQQQGHTLSSLWRFLSEKGFVDCGEKNFVFLVRDLKLEFEARLQLENGVPLAADFLSAKDL